MPGAIVQSGYAVDDSGTAQTTFQVVLTGVTAGNHLVVMFGWQDPTNAITATCSDGTAFTSGDSRRFETGDTQSSQPFYRENVGSGSHTIVVTPSSAVNFLRLRAVEISGLATSSSLDQSTGNAQTAPGSGANAITTGATAATTNANDFILGFCQNCSEIDPGVSVISAGTGYVLNGTNNILAVESKSVAATGAQTATFTQTGTTPGFTSHVLAFKEASSGPAAGPQCGRLTYVNP